MASIQAAGSVRIGVGTDLPGYGWVDAAGHRSGLEINLAQLISQSIFGGDIHAAAAHVDFVECIARNREQMLVDGEVDLVISSLAITSDRRQKVDFAGVYYGSHVGFVTRKGESPDMSTCVFGVVEGALHERFLRRSELGSRIVTFEDSRQVAEALAAGTVDCWSDPRSCLAAFLSDESTGRFELAPQVGPFNSWAAGVAKGDSELGDFVESRIREVVETGSLMWLSGA